MSKIAPTNSGIPIGVLVISIVQTSETQWRWLLDNRTDTFGKLLQTWSGLETSPNLAFKAGMTCRSQILLENATKRSEYNAQN